MSCVYLWFWMKLLLMFFVGSWPNGESSLLSCIWSKWLTYSFGEWNITGCLCLVWIQFIYYLNLYKNTISNCSLRKLWQLQLLIFICEFDVWSFMQLVHFSSQIYFCFSVVSFGNNVLKLQKIILILMKLLVAIIVLFQIWMQIDKKMTS